MVLVKKLELASAGVWTHNDPLTACSIPSLNRSITLSCRVIFVTTTRCFHTYKHLCWRFENCFCFQNSTILIVVFVLYVLVWLYHIIIVVVFLISLFLELFLNSFSRLEIGIFGFSEKIRTCTSWGLNSLFVWRVSMFVKHLFSCV